MHAKLLSGGQDGATHSRPGAAGAEGTGGTGRPDCDAGGRRWGLAGQRVDVPPHKAPQAPPIWRAPEGPEGRTAMPEGCGKAWPWPDNESTRRAKLAARTAGGPPPTSTPSSPAPRATPRAGRRPRAHQAARPHNRVLHRPEHQRRHQHRRNTSGATRYLGIAKPPSPAGAGRLNQYQRIIEESRQYRDYRDRFPGVRSRYRASRRCPWRCLPSGDPRRRRWRPEWSSRRRSRRWSPRIRPGSGSGPAGWRTPECRCR